MARMISRRNSRAGRLILLTGVWLVIISRSGFAQNSFDMGTPAEFKGGMSALSTYAQDKVETVNLANGNLNLHIALATLGGRGSASFTVALNYNSKLWSPQHDVEPANPITQCGPIDHFSAAYDDLPGKAPNILFLGGG